MTGAASGPTTVLFLCTGNAGRSILAEAMLNRLGAPGVVAYSAGVRPKGQVDPHALALLNARGIETAGLRSKSWDAFARAGAPQLDLVITVCDRAAEEPCPVWPGRPATAHWSIPDPAAATHGAAAAFADAYDRLEAHIVSFLADHTGGVRTDSPPSG